MAHTDEECGKPVWKKHVKWSFDNDVLDEATRTPVPFDPDISSLSVDLSLTPEAGASGQKIAHDVRVGEIASLHAADMVDMVDMVDTCAVPSTAEVLPRSDGLRVEKLSAPLRGPRYRVSSNFEPTNTAQPAYRERDEVEFFSSTHQKWFLGIVFLEVLREGAHDDRFVRFLYNVRVGLTRQMRRDVGLDLLRVPLQEGDLVEVGDWRLPRGAVGRITRIVRHPMDRHFEVLMDDTAVRQVVSGTVLQRHLPLHSEVLAYRGPDHGWVCGLVEDRRFRQPDGSPVDDADVLQAPVRKRVIPCVVVDVFDQNETTRSVHDLSISFTSSMAKETEWVAAHMVLPTSRMERQVLG